MSGYKATFNVSDEHLNTLGASVLVDEFSTHDFEQGTLSNVKSVDNVLSLDGGKDTEPQLQVEYSGSYGTFSAPFPHWVLLCTKKFRGDLAVTPIAAGGAGGSGTVEFGWVAADGSSHTPLAYVAVSLGDTEIIVPDIAMDVGQYYYIGHNGYDNNRFSSNHSPSAPAEFLQVVADNQSRADFIDNFPTRTYGFRAISVYAYEYEEEGSRVSLAADLSAFGTSNPDLRIKVRKDVPDGTSFSFETAVIDSDTTLPVEGDWEEQISGALLTNNLSGDLSGKYLWARIKLSTEDISQSPFIDWVVIWEDDGSSEPKAVARVEFADDVYKVDETGTAEAEDIESVITSEQVGPSAVPESSFHTGDYGLRFAAYEKLRIKKASIRAEAAGQDVFELWAYDYIGGESPSQGTKLYEKVVDFEAGLNEVEFKWEVPAGFHYWIGRPEGLLGLTRASYSFPAAGSIVGFLVEGGESYTGSTAANWYYVYNLHVEVGMPYTVHVMSLNSPYRYSPQHDFALYMEEDDISVEVVIKTIKADLTNLGFQVEQVIEEIKRIDITSLGFQVEISEPIIIDFEGFGIESREQVSTSDFIILGTTATGISVFPASLTIMPGGLAVLQATIRPPDAADRDVIWSTSDYSVLSVVGDGERGTIRGHLEGTATITAVSRDGGYLATCQVAVEEKAPVPYEAIKILRPNFSEIVTLDNTEIVDLMINKELSGHYGVEFTLPVGVTGWEEIRRGRYIETEGQKFAIEQIRPVRQSDGIPLLQVTCSHIFFEIERVNMPHDTTARSTIQDHVNYVLRNTGFVTLATDKENHFYQIDRVIDYSASDSRFTAFQRIFQVFGGHYRLNDFTVEIIPPRPTPPTSAVVLEYAVTNAAIEKHEDDADVITTLYATGGQVDGVPLERVVQAGPEIRALYRKERVRFVNFGDIRVWNNFVYVTDQYLEKRQLPRTTYSLSVAELKRINDIENLYPERDFELDIGKVVQVKDTELGIDTQKLLQRYTYKPLQPDHLSSVIVGDKPFDIAFTEISREGVVQEEEGEWRYDEGTREWIFFPTNPIIEDDTGEDYTLTITEHPSSCGPAGIRYRYHTGENRPEKSTLTIEEGATASGKVIVILDTEIYSVEIEEGDTPEMVALKIAAAEYPGWETEQVDNVVVFTAKRVGAKRYSADYRFGLTGAIGGFVTLKGAQEAFTSDWKDAGLPFEQTFNEGDEVQVIARSDSKWYSLVDWTGDGEGFSPRLYIMDSNQSSQVRFASTAGAIDVRTRTPSNVTEDSAVLQGEILDPSKFGSVERGFVWAYASNPTLSSNEGQIWAGTGGKGSFSAAFPQPVGDPYDQRYYYRAYAKAYDQECQWEMVAYGITRSFSFAYEECSVEVVVMTIDDIELDAPVNVQPGQGVFFFASGTNVTLDIESASLPAGATFERWLIVDEQTGAVESVTENPYSFEVSSSYRITAIIARPAIVLWVNQEEGTGVIQIADSPDGPRTSWRLGLAMRLDKTVYVWTVPDDESQQGRWTEDSGGVGEEPRVFELGEEFVEYRATVRWSPLHVCEKRCIFISPDDPDPTVGVDGNIWLKYRE